MDKLLPVTCLWYLAFNRNPLEILVCSNKRGMVAEDQIRIAKEQLMAINKFKLRNLKALEKCVRVWDTFIRLLESN